MRSRARPTRPARRRAGARGKVRYGVVGLGWFAQVAILPAFAHARENSELSALFSDDPEKLRNLGRRHHVITIGERTRRKNFRKRDQVAPEILYFSDCILEDRTPEPSGREGLADVRVIEALYRSARTGRAVELPPFTKKRRPSLRQEIHRPASGRQPLVHVEAPSAG